MYERGRKEYSLEKKGGVRVWKENGKYDRLRKGKEVIDYGRERK